MRIDRLGLTAFGRFLGGAVDLAPGLNVVYGQNEAGKTTMQKFMLGMLYGFKKKAQRRDYTDDMAHYRPWQSEEYRGSLTYTLDRTGRTYRVERVFDPRREEVRIYDALTGLDLSDRFPTDRRKELLFADEHIGVPEEVFRSTAWVGQMEVGKLELGRELVNRVANMQESGREDLSVRTALRLLADRMREIGTDRAPTRPYARLARQLEEKRLELERATQAREQTMVWEAQLTEVRAVLSEIDQELAELYRRVDWSLLREARERLERVTAGSRGAREARRRAAELSPYAGFPVHLRERLSRALARVAGAQEQVRRHQERTVKLQLQQDDLRLQQQVQPAMATAGSEAAALLKGMASAAQAGADQLAALREEATRLTEMVARIEETVAPLRPAATSGEPVLNRVDATEKEMASLRLQLDLQNTESLRMEVSRLERSLRQSGGWVWLVLGVVAGAAGGALASELGDLVALPGAALWPTVGGAGSLAVLCLMLFAFARRRAAGIGSVLAGAREELQTALSRASQTHERLLALERQREKALSSVGATSGLEVRGRVVRYEQLSARRDGQQMRLDAVNAEIARIHAEAAHRQEGLYRLMALALGQTPAELEAESDPVQRFLQVHAAHQDLHYALEALERELADAGRREREEAELGAAAGAEAAAVLAEAGVADPAEFDRACTLREAWASALAEAEVLEAALGSLLGAESVEDLAQQVANLEGEVEGAQPAESHDSAWLQAEARRLAARRAELSARSSGLAARIETALQDLADTADLYREIAALQEERQALDAELASLDLAHQAITEVSAEIHREFAPKLNQAMGEVVAALTSGKYRNVKIDETMMIRTITNDERTVDLMMLSGGTIDQFYFGLRVALLDLLTEGQERIPLILDDPFVQYDQLRLQAGIEYLASLSRERQVILMTCHQREVREALESGVPVHVIDISKEMAGDAST